MSTQPSLPIEQPALPGKVRGVIGHDDDGWTVQCSGCLDTFTSKHLIIAVNFALFCRPHPEIGRLCKPCGEKHYAETGCISKRKDHR